MRDDCFSQAFEDQVETTQCVAPISRPKFYSVQLRKRLIYELDDRGPFGGCGTPIRTQPRNGGILRGRMVLCSGIDKYENNKRKNKPNEGKIGGDGKI
jgi:hypothetical protein